MPFLTEEKYKQLSQVLDGVISELDRMQTEQLYDVNALYCINGIGLELDNITGDVYLLDPLNKTIQGKMRGVYAELKPIYILCLPPEEFTPYIDKAKKSIQEIRTYLEGKREKKGE